MNAELHNDDADALRETTNYDVILAQQSFSMRDISEHLTGPLIAIISHLILIPILLGIVIMPAAEDKAGVEIKSVTEEITPLPEKPEELEEPEVTDPQETDVDRPETADVEEESTSIDDAELSEDMNSDEPPMIMMMDNQSNKTLKNVFIGRGGGGGRGGKGFGSRGGRKEKANNFEGYLFDLKQNAGGSPTAMAKDQGAFCNVLREFVNSKDWSLDDWSKKYYRSPEPLYNPCIYIPLTGAEQAPIAFECADKVKPSRWVVIYKASLIAPKTASYRFVGAGDDLICARVNKKLVFDYGWYMASLGHLIANAGFRAAMMQTGGSDKDKNELKNSGIYTQPVKFYTYRSIPEWNGNLGGLCAGEPFSVRAGDVIDVEVLITEIPGGRFGAVLLIEEIGAPYEKEGNSPIVSLFRTNNDPMPKPELGAPPYDPDRSPIWKVSVGGSKAASAPKEQEQLITL